MATFNFHLFVLSHGVGNCQLRNCYHVMANASCFLSSYCHLKVECQLDFATVLLAIDNVMWCTAKYRNGLLPIISFVIANLSAGSLILAASLIWKSITFNKKQNLKGDRDPFMAGNSRVWAGFSDENTDAPHLGDLLQEPVGNPLQPQQVPHQELPG